jgi:hypothetical protein
VLAELATLPGLHLMCRGDGAGERATPASALDVSFFPDLAVYLGSQNLWATEVKFLRQTGRQNSLATALGQATLYRSRYEHVAVVLIDTYPSSRPSQLRLIEDAHAVDLQIVIRSRIGGTLIAQPFEPQVSPKR